MAETRRRASWITDPIDLLLAIGFTARVARLLAVDEFPPAERLRDAVEARLPADYRHGVNCVHCVGFWCALAATIGAEACDRAGHRHTWRLACAPWAIAAVAGWLAEHEHT